MIVSVPRSEYFHCGHSVPAAYGSLDTPQVSLAGTRHQEAAPAPAPLSPHAPWSLSTSSSRCRIAIVSQGHFWCSIMQLYILLNTFSDVRQWNMQLCLEKKSASTISASGDVWCNYGRTGRVRASCCCEPGKDLEYSQPPARASHGGSFNPKTPRRYFLYPLETWKNRTIGRNGIQQSEDRRNGSR